MNPRLDDVAPSPTALRIAGCQRGYRQISSRFVEGGHAMASQSKTTRDHDEIRTWVEEHDGHPASVRGTGNGDPGVLRIDFPGGAGEDQLEHVSWDEWFEKFDANDLAFLYQ